MDGVIIDSHPAHRKAWRKFLHSLGRDVTNHELDFILDGRKRAEILRYFLGEISEAQLEEHGKRKDDFFHDLEMEVKPIPGVVSFLDGLRKRKIATAVATSASESRARSHLGAIAFNPSLSGRHYRGDVAKGKPDPAIYRLACLPASPRPSTSSPTLRRPSKNALAIEDAVLRNPCRQGSGAALRRSVHPSVGRGPDGGGSRLCDRQFPRGCKSQAGSLPATLRCGRSRSNPTPDQPGSTRLAADPRDHPALPLRSSARVPSDPASSIALQAASQNLGISLPAPRFLERPRPTSRVPSESPAEDRSHRELPALLSNRVL